MKKLELNKISLTEAAAIRVAEWVNTQLKEDNKAYLKLKLGLEMLFINITKMLIVYSMAYILNLLTATIIFHLSYYLIRKNAYGVHAKTSALCSLISVLYFVGIPYVATLVTIPNAIILVIYLINAVILYFFAPSFTRKSAKMSDSRKLKLRNQSMMMCFILMLVTLFIATVTTKNLLTFGATLACLLTIQKHSNLEGRESY
ncbi:hypothetical protein D8M04_15180 [Oceanobacillus piezotolerans]|uniref:Putative AgrB-like protein n=1 Tax=Oceanobacillus piezotolerans TaxID=2448030 RepID=A0A498D4K3_9BACI|nr:accessory gene regulator B family protein [Oceanobacillus piezotolerans]RLL42889.1 hypothetical protein D8M04_15180 [Oceanobacillus piezotolerans]